MIITIDGPSGAGKSTISRAYAQAYDFRYINSGALYRTVAYILQTYCPNDEPSDYIKKENYSIYTDSIIPSIDLGIDVGMDEKDEYIFVNIPHSISGEISPANDSKNYTNHSLSKAVLFNKEIDSIVSYIASIGEIRHAINTRIRSICSEGNWIIEGRDAGSNIMPNALYKFYLDASIEERTRRRAIEYNTDTSPSTGSISGTAPIDATTIHDLVQKRDEIDTKYGNLQKIKDAIYIDTTKYTIEEIINTIYNITIKQ